VVCHLVAKKELGVAKEKGCVAKMGKTVVKSANLLAKKMYHPDCAGGAGRGGGSGADPFPTMLDGLPGFIAEDIAALLHDLPLPAVGDIPGMTVDEAIQVFHVIQDNMVCTMLCMMLCKILDAYHVI
jgi:hypothetical protein